MSDLRLYIGRFLLPLALLLAGLGTWTLANQLGTVERTAAQASPAASSTEPFTSIRRLPEFATASSRDDALAAALASLPAEPGGLSCVAIYIDGEPVLAQGSDRTLVPAYAQLLITGHAALELLGPDYQYETQVFADSLPDDNGRIFNGAYLIGGGDPGLMSFNYSLGFRPARSAFTAIEDLAQGVADAGVVRIDGGIIAVERRYDQERMPPSWPDQYLVDGVTGPLTALQLDDGFVERAAANLGVAVPSEAPATLAAERFAGLLGDLELQVFGEARTLASDEELPQLVPVARVFSPRLKDIVFQTLAVNDATAGEMILKELGALTQGDGTTQAGGQAVQRVLVTQGVEVPVAFLDGSGLDPFGGTSCTQLAQTADSIPQDHPTLEVLPAYDLPGVFGGEFSDIAIESDLRLVGGVHRDAAGLVARTVDQGPRVTIASIVNRPGGPQESDIAYQRALVGLVDALRPSISFEGLSIGE